MFILITHLLGKKLKRLIQKLSKGVSNMPPISHIRYHLALRGQYISKVDPTGGSIFKSQAGKQNITKVFLVIPVLDSSFPLITLCGVATSFPPLRMLNGLPHLKSRAVLWYSNRVNRAIPIDSLKAVSG